MARPGIMLYFDILEPIRALTDEDKGRLLVAMLEYGQSGRAPVFDGMLALAWGFVKPKIDRDDETYENAKLQRKYAAFCKKRAALNLSKVPFEVWVGLTDNERERALTADNEPLRAVDLVASRYPTTTATAAASTSTSTTATAAAAATTLPAADAAAAGTENGNIYSGDHGGNVTLTDAQADALIRQLGQEKFDYYVDRLSGFIIQTGARVKNHYETILKWWQEDSRAPGRNKFQVPVPRGASGRLGSAELEAIARVLQED